MPIWDTTAKLNTPNGGRPERASLHAAGRNAHSGACGNEPVCTARPRALGRARHTAACRLCVTPPHAQWLRRLYRLANLTGQNEILWDIDVEADGCSNRSGASVEYRRESDIVR